MKKIIRVKIIADLEVSEDFNSKEKLAIGKWQEGKNGEDDKILLSDNDFEVLEYIDIIEE